MRLCVSQPLSNQALFQLPRLTKVLFSTFVLAALVVHFAKTVFATTSLDTFLWFILQKLLLQSLPRKLFRENPIFMQAVLLRLFTAQPGRAEGCGQGSIAQVLSGS